MKSMLQRAWAYIRQFVRGLMHELEDWDRR